MPAAGGSRRGGATPRQTLQYTGPVAPVSKADSLRVSVNYP